VLIAPVMTVHLPRVADSREWMKRGSARLHQRAGKAKGKRPIPVTSLEIHGAPAKQAKKAAALLGNFSHA
jgi:hypothetical protein